jgi:hypothetical protein
LYIFNLLKHSNPMLGKLRIWLLVVGLVTHAYAQDLTIKGKITDNSGAELPGVNVTVKGTQKGVVSDAEGKYLLNGVPSKATLVFSFIGYLKQEIEVNNRTVIDVVLEADVKSINEVGCGRIWYAAKNRNYGLDCLRQIVGLGANSRCQRGTGATSARIGDSD